MILTDKFVAAQILIDESVAYKLLLDELYVALAEYGFEVSHSLGYQNIGTSCSQVK